MLIMTVCGAGARMNLLRSLSGILSRLGAFTTVAIFAQHDTESESLRSRKPMYCHWRTNKTAGVYSLVYGSPTGVTVMRKHVRLHGRRLGNLLFLLRA